MKPLRLALLSVFPPATPTLLSDDGPADEDPRGAWLTVEGHLIASLARSSDVDLHVVTIDKHAKQREVIQYGDKLVLHRLQGKPGSGMLTAWLPRALAVRSYLRRVVRPQLVHGMRTDYGYATMAIFSGFPNIFTIEGFLRYTPHPPRYKPLFWVGSLAEAWTIKRAKNIIAISNHVQREIEHSTKGRIFRVPNMIDEPFYSLVKKRKLKRKVVYVGRLTPEKGLLDVVQTAALLESQGEAAIHWAIVGGPTGHEGDAYLEQCKQQAAALSTHSVGFLGWVPNARLPDLFADAACAVFPYQAPYETFANSVGEAMATGTPPIVYDYGPLPEHIEDKQSGFIVPPGDIGELAEKVSCLVNSPKLSLEMGQRARDRAGSYRRVRVVAQLLEAYQEIVRQGK